MLLPAESGCSKRISEKAKKELQKHEKKEKPKAPFDQYKVFTEPNEQSTFDPEAESPPPVRTAVKPGHWTNVLVEIRANLDDFSGDLMAQALDNQQLPIDLERSTWHLSTARRIGLAKGQRKTLETMFFAPPTQLRTSTWMAARLRNRRGAEEWVPPSEPITHMPSFQYYLVVLARDSSRYSYLKVLDSVRPPSEFASVNAEDTAYYRVLYPAVNQSLALPSEPLCWTSTAVVIWDDVLPTSLTPEQQQSLVDWVHWGGNLIISGPQSLDQLRGSLLDPYLPASGSETAPIDAATLAPWNEHWSLVTARGERTTLQPVQPWSGVKLTLNPAGTFVPHTAELVATRRVGRGRITTTAFRLTEPDLRRWKSFDSFFNACLLARPRRTFDSNKNQWLFVDHESKANPDRYDPALISNVRYFSRDARRKSDATRHKAVDIDQDQPVTTTLPGGVSSAGFVTYAPMADNTDLYKSQCGVAAWDDFSAVSNLARGSLREAAGIAVPKREFVLWMIGLYLLLIVPINWLVFRAMGRVEWAWIAVPVIALGWGLMVVWLAQLDIGFARAETELSVLESHAGFPRAHLTRYTALYSSLSTQYDVHLESASAVAQPFSVDLKMLQGQARTAATLRGAGQNELTGYMVSSNSTGMIHSEQMCDLKGSLVWERPAAGPATLENSTETKLSGALVLWRRENDEDDKSVCQAAWLGELIPGAKVEVAFGPYDEREIKENREQSPETSAGAGARLSLHHLTDFAQDVTSLEPGEVRLVAWTADRIEGLRIEPSGRARRATLVVSHLEYGPDAPPLPDENLRSEVTAPAIDFAPESSAPETEPAPEAPATP